MGRGKHAYTQASDKKGQKRVVNLLDLELVLGSSESANLGSLQGQQVFSLMIYLSSRLALSFPVPCGNHDKKMHALLCMNITNCYSGLSIFINCWK